MELSGFFRWMGMGHGETMADTCTAIVSTEDDGTIWKDGVAGLEKCGANCHAAVVLGKTTHTVSRKLDST